MVWSCLLPSHVQHELGRHDAPDEYHALFLEFSAEHIVAHVSGERLEPPESFGRYRVDPEVFETILWFRELHLAYPPRREGMSVLCSDSRWTLAISGIMVCSMGVSVVVITGSGGRQQTSESVKVKPRWRSVIYVR